MRGLAKGEPGKAGVVHYNKAEKASLTVGQVYHSRVPLQQSVLSLPKVKVARESDSGRIIMMILFTLRVV